MQCFFLLRRRGKNLGIFFYFLYLCLQVYRVNEDIAMWILRWIFAAGFVILGIGFAMQNADQLVTISLLHWKSQNTPLWVVMYLAFAMGVFFWMIVSLFKAVTLRTENQRIVKETKKLKEELDRLRNISVEEAMAFLESSAKSLNPGRKE